MNTGEAFILFIFFALFFIPAAVVFGICVIGRAAGEVKRLDDDS